MRSEISDAPCVIIKPEEDYVILGNYYRAQIILTCEKPLLANQITVKTDLKGESYIKDGNIYWQYRSAVSGEISFHGEVLFKNKDGNIQKFPFQDKFYSALPNSSIANNKLNYLIRGEENSLSIVAPGFRNSEISVTAINANIRRDTLWKNHYGFYKVVPNGNDTVFINTSISKYGKKVDLGTFTFKVVNKISIN